MRKSAILFPEECGYIAGRARLYFCNENSGFLKLLRWSGQNYFYLTRVLLKVVSVLFLLLKGFIQDNKVLPRVLNLNLDNCWRLVFKFQTDSKFLEFRENKNRYLLGFLHALVDLRIFDEITLDFLLVGHTG